MATQNTTTTTTLTTLAHQWNQYWRTWDEETKTHATQTSWSPSVLHAYNTYRNAIEKARTEAVHKIRELDSIRASANQKGANTIESSKVLRFQQDLTLARIEANHLERDSADLKQELADAKCQFVEADAQRERDHRRRRELEQMSVEDIVFAKEMAENEFVCAHTQAWHDLVEANERNGWKGGGDWPRYPPGLMEGYNGSDELDRLNGYGSV